MAQGSGALALAGDLRLDSQHPHGSSQTFTASVPGTMMPSSDFFEHRHHVRMVYRHTCKQNTHTCKIVLLFFKGADSEVSCVLEPPLALTIMRSSCILGALGTASSHQQLPLHL